MYDPSDFDVDNSPLDDIWDDDIHDDTFSDCSSLNV
jgi:hypothetical protein